MVFLMNYLFRLSRSGIHVRRNIRSADTSAHHALLVNDFIACSNILSLLSFAEITVNQRDNYNDCNEAPSGYRDDHPQAHHLFNRNSARCVRTYAERNSLSVVIKCNVEVPHKSVSEYVRRVVTSSV